MTDRGGWPAAWVGARRQAVLATIRRDGGVQTSNVATAFDPTAGWFRVSLTAGRAKTANLRREPRGTLHLLGPDFGSYLSVVVRAELTAGTETAGDAVGVELLELYESIAGRHPDHAEFHAAMLTERRLVARLHPVSWSGWGVGGHTR